MAHIYLCSIQNKRPWSYIFQRTFLAGLHSVGGNGSTFQLDRCHFPRPRVKQSFHYQIVKVFHSVVSDPIRHATSFQRLEDVYVTSPTLYRRLTDVETTLCVYWDKSLGLHLVRFIFTSNKWVYIRGASKTGQGLFSGFFVPLVTAQAHVCKVYTRLCFKQVFDKHLKNAMEYHYARNTDLVCYISLKLVGFS